jgi:predicted membrane protein
MAMPFPFLIPTFFFSAWLAMVFWGMVAPDVGVATIGYPKAMLITIGLWLVLFPLAKSTAGAPAGKFQMARRAGRPAGPARAREGEWQTAGQDAINISSSFAGEARRITSQNFQGGNVSANFGGVKLDLTQAKLSGSGATLDARAFLGGIDIVVPEEWDVDVNVSAFLGGVADERSRPGTHTSGAPSLVINGSATLGGISIKDA